jgi:hypothetical protein
MAWDTYNVITSKQTKQAMHVFMAGSNFKLSSPELELFIKMDVFLWNMPIHCMGT